MHYDFPHKNKSPSAATGSVINPVPARVLTQRTQNQQLLFFTDNLLLLVESG
jgi:hypothetical protein